MSVPTNTLAQAKAQVLYAPGTVDADGLEGGAASALVNRDGMGLLILQTAAATGTDNPVLDVKLQHKDETGDSLVDSEYVFPQMVAAGGIQVVPIDVRKLKKYVQVSFNIDGTTPAFPSTSVILIYLPKYTSMASPPDLVTAVS